MVVTLDELLGDSRIPDDLKNGLRSTIDAIISENSRLKREEDRRREIEKKQKEAFDRLISKSIGYSNYAENIHYLDEHIVKELREIFGTEFHARMYEIENISKRDDIKEHIASIEPSKNYNPDIALKAIIDTRQEFGALDDKRRYIAIVDNNVTGDAVRFGKIILAREHQIDFELPEDISVGYDYKGRFPPFIKNRIGFPIYRMEDYSNKKVVDKVIMLDKGGGPLTRDEIIYARDFIASSEHLRDMITTSWSLVRSFAHDMKASEVKIGGLINWIIRSINTKPIDDYEARDKKLIAFAEQISSTTNHLKSYLEKRMSKGSKDRPEEFYISDIFEKEVSDRSKTIESNKIKVIYENIDDIPVFEYKDRLRLALGVILDNSIEAIIDRDLKGQANIYVNSIKKDNKVIFSYRDNALGMSADDFKRVMSSEEYTTKTYGHGIGINNIKKIEGLSIKNTPGVGLEYEFVLKTKE